VIIFFVYFNAYGIAIISCEHVTTLFFNKFHFISKLLFMMIHTR